MQPLVQHLGRASPGLVVQMPLTPAVLMHDSPSGCSLTKTHWSSASHLKVVQSSVLQMVPLLPQAKPC
jgi:hypothetical protein